MAQPKGHQAKHSTDQGVYPNVVMGSGKASVKIRRPSTSASGLKARTKGMGAAPARKAKS